jgi:hypothetical protein
VRLFDVTTGVVQQADDVMVIERVEREAAGAPDSYETRGSQQAKLMGYGRLGQSDQRRQVTDTSLAVGEGIQKPDARRIAEQLEDVGHRLDDAARE